jgi:hypothetical protein
MFPPLFRIVRPAPASAQEIERTVAGCHPLLEGNRVAAFSVEGRKGVVIVAEVSRRLHRLWQLDLTGDENPLITEVKQAIRLAVARRHRLKADAVILVSRHALPRQPNGDLEYNQCRRAYLQNAFSRLDRLSA